MNQRIAFFGLALFVTAASSGCSVGPYPTDEGARSASGDDGALSASSETSGTDDLFAVGTTGKLTNASLKTLFGKKPATLGNFVVGMRTRDCQQGWPSDECGDWVASTNAVIPMLTDGGLEWDFPPLNAPGTTSLSFQSVSGTPFVAVVSGKMTVWPKSPTLLSTGSPVYVTFKSPIGSGATPDYFVDSGPVSGLCGLLPSVMTNNYFIEQSPPLNTEHRGDGTYSQREFVFYARLRAKEKSVLRADGSELYVDWCVTDAQGNCVQ
jgi:hypothetical protein